MADPGVSKSHGFRRSHRTPTAAEADNLQAASQEKEEPQPASIVLKTEQSRRLNS
ncbi:MAG: hypothetical protein ACOVNL_01205 [Prochlorococcaceae cyanobacterium]|jgi:hypothetical protein